MNPDTFFQQYNGKYVNVDHIERYGYYPYQCVDCVQQYAIWLGLHLFTGNAADIINQADASYQRVSSPLKGDIVIFARSPANGNAGHIAIVTQDGNGHATFGQHYPGGTSGGSPCHYQNVPDPILGYLRPKNIQGADVGIPQAQYDAAIAANQAAALEARRNLVADEYRLYLGRSPKDNEYASWENKTPPDITSGIRNSEEAKAFQSSGFGAGKDNKLTQAKTKAQEIVNL